MEAQYMLCLTRDRDEQVVIDLRAHGLGLVTVTVLKILGDSVRLGITAPLDVPVHRREIYAIIERERLRNRREQP
jgi:carbon storage regulator